MASREWRWHEASTTVALLSTDTTLTYQLPWGVSSVDAIFLPLNQIEGAYVDPVTWQRVADSDPSSGGLCWTVRPSSDNGYYDVKIYNGAGYADTLTLTYRRRPRDLRLTGWEPDSRAGKIATTLVSGTTYTAAGTSTAFSAWMVGSVIRLTTDPSFHPESLVGLRPYTAEGIVLTHDSTTAMSFKLLGYTEHASTNCLYVVTDLLDMSPTMYTALLSGSEAWIARLTGKPSDAATGIYMRDLRMAFEGDAVAPFSGRRNGSGISAYAWWHQPQGADGGV